MKKIEKLTQAQIDRMAEIRDKLAESGAPAEQQGWRAIVLDEKLWESVGESVGESVRASVWESARESVGASVWESVWESVRDSVADQKACFPTSTPETPSPEPQPAPSTLEQVLATFTSKAQISKAFQQLKRALAALAR